MRERQEENGWRVRIDGLLGIHGDPAAQVHCHPDGRWRHPVTLEIETHDTGLLI